MPAPSTTSESSATSNAWSATARILADAHRNDTRLSTFPSHAPTTLEQAYALQRSILDALSNAPGGAVAGWKIGCTSEIARNIMGAAEPIFGPVLASRLHANGAHVSTGDNALRAVETEIALELNATLSPRDTAYTLDEVRHAIAAVYPAFEVVNKRLPGDLSADLLWIVADFSANQALVLGPRMPFDPALSLSELKASVQVNAQPPVGADASRALGGPDHALTWFVNAASNANISLARGQIITTGLISELIVASPGDRIHAKFEHIGEVSMTID